MHKIKGIHGKDDEVQWTHWGGADQLRVCVFVDTLMSIFHQSGVCLCVCVCVCVDASM
jgi:hypothetical protein